MSKRNGLILAGMVLVLGAMGVAKGETAAAADPAKVDKDFAIQGEYVGEYAEDPDEKTKVGAQIIALGDGKFQVVGYPGGLPGDGWDNEVRERIDGEAKDGAAVFVGQTLTGTVKEGVMTVVNREGKQVATLKKVLRKSVTLGAKPPAGAVVLFDGTSADEWKEGKMTEEGLLMQGTETQRKFKDCSLHVEFRLPYEPKGRGQGRGNSGVYMQGCFETQVLDSFGLEAKNNECGGIYSVADPLLPMSYPPLSWQTYDIDFTAPVFDATGKKTKNATMTVKFNGVLIHEKVEVPGPTTAAPRKESVEGGPIYIQDHGHAVRFRNIWVVEKK